MRRAISKDSGLVILSQPLIVPERSVSPIKTSMGGFFRCKVRKAKDLRLVDDTGWFRNLITDQGLNRIGTAGYGSYLHVGAGATTPANANTSLVTPIAATQNIISSANNVQGSAPYYGHFTNTWRFVAGTATGTIAELGLGWGANATSTLFSRALILDDLDAPTTIVIASDEVLDVSYQVRLYPPLSDAAGTVDVSGPDYATVTRASQVTNIVWNGQYLQQHGVNGPSINSAVYSGAIGSITGIPSGTQGGGQAAAASAYSNNSLVRRYTFPYNLDSGNVSGGAKSLLLQWSYSLGHYQIEFDTPIPKNNTKVMSFVADISWTRN